MRSSLPLAGLACLLLSSPAAAQTAAQRDLCPVYQNLARAVMMSRQDGMAKEDAMRSVIDPQAPESQRRLEATIVERAWQHEVLPGAGAKDALGHSFGEEILDACMSLGADVPDDQAARRPAS